MSIAVVLSGGRIFDIGPSIFATGVLTAATPTFSPVGGTYSGTQTVTISCSTPSSTIYYTTDGTTPTFPITGSTQQYTGTLSISTNTNVQAIGVAGGFLNSAIGSATYVIGSGTGFLAAGHFINAKQPMIQVYPRPDTETNTWARHRWAYYDGVNSVPYSIPIGVSFGAFPYVFTLDSGSTALGMSIVAPFWNTAWTSYAQAMSSGYGYLQWTPSATVSGHTVTITVTDQQLNTLTITFTISTSSATSRFIFVDSVHGSDSTGTGSIGAPWATYTHAFGSAFNTNINANALCYFRTGTYTVPGQLTASGVTFTQVNTSIKPSAMIGFPGDTPPVFDMTTSNCFFSDTNTGASTDLFVQGLNPNGYTTSTFNMRWFWLTIGGTQRVTFDGNNWTNSGYGSSAPSNTPMFFMDFTSGQATYIFLRNNSEERVTSGHAGNNIVGCDTYFVNKMLVEGNQSNTPTLTVDGCWIFKSDVTNSSMRGNFASFHDCAYPYSFLQDPQSGTNNNEVCYNKFIVQIFAGNGSSGPFFPVNTPGTITTPMFNLWGYRNSIIGNLGSNSPNNGGPYVFENNMVQTTVSPAIQTGSSITSSNNQTATTGALDTTACDLQGTFRTSFLGTVGAEIA